MKTQRTSIAISFVFGLGVAACQGTLHTGMEGQGGSTGGLGTGGMSSGGSSGGTAGQSATGATTAGGVAGATVGGTGGTSGSNSCGTHDQFGPRLAVRTIGSAGGDPYDGPAIVEQSTSDKLVLYFVLPGATGGTDGTGPDSGLPASTQDIHATITGLDPMPILAPGAKLWLSKNPAGNQESEVLMYGIAPWSLSARNRQGGDLLFGAARNQFDAVASPLRIGTVTPDCTALDVDPYSCTPGASTTYSSVEVEGDTPVVIHDSVPGTVTLGGIEYDVRATAQKLSSAVVVCMDHHDSDYSGVALDIQAKNLADLVGGSTGGLGTGGIGAGGIIAGTGGNPDGGMGTGGNMGGGGSGGNGSGGNGSGKVPLQHRSTSASCPSQRGPGPSCVGTMCSSCSFDSQCTDGVNGRCFPWEGLVSLGGCSYDECFTDSNCRARTPCLCRSSSTDNSANVCDVGGNCAVDSDCGPGGYCSPSMETCFSAAPEVEVQDNYAGPNPYYCHTASDLCINDSDCAPLDAGTVTNPMTYTPCAYNVQNSRWECTQFTCGLP